MIFESIRLDIRSFEQKDFESFEELVTNPIILDPIPGKPWSKELTLKMFNNNLELESIDQNVDTIIWGIFLKDKSKMIGLCGLLRNDEGDREIGYRFLEEYWGKGYGTELTKHFIHFCFEELGIQKLTADVNIANIGSVKILDKFFKPVRDFFNEDDDCMDRRYCLFSNEFSI